MKVKSNFKIAVVCNKLANSGGMERYTLDILKGFVSLGFRPVVLTKSFDQTLDILSQIEVIKIPCFFLPKRFRDFYFSARVAKLKKSRTADIFIGCCRCRNIDVMVSGGTHPGFLKNTKKRFSWYDRLVLPFEKAAYNDARYIVAHSNLIYEEIGRFYPNCVQKTRLIYPPVNMEKFRVDHNVKLTGFREKLGIQKENKLFLFVSSSHKRKGFPLLETFFENTSLPVSLVICGRKLPKKHYRNIYSLGYQTNISKIYPEVDCSVLASTYEPFGLVAIESLCMGVPVVISNRLGSNEVIRASCKEVFDPQDIDSLRGAVEKFLRNESEIKTCALSANNKKFKTDLSLTHHIEELLALCSEFLKTSV